MCLSFHVPHVAQGQDGGTTDPGAHGKKFTTADMAADKKSITTSPKGSSQNDSPKGVGRDGRRERGVPGMKQRTCKRYLSTL